MSLQLDRSDTWTCALLGGLLAAPFTALQVIQSPDSIMFNMVVVGGALAGYLVKRRGGNGTATGLRAGFVGGLPALWGVAEFVWSIPSVANPLWFQAVGVAMGLSVGALAMLIPALGGALAGRFGGWLAERQGHPRVPAAGG
ncbi:hypothetical protein BVU17_12645 [Haloarcula taiwanensis]|uniref:DUF5518 domain-containing protein n=1 Tax=Haloarcula taiwanensis TaxID=1932004 RepID=A0A2H5A0S4_9EURY|nr:MULTISPECIES: DUF5518 domain-containing protein [Haloarcula]AUG48329.1 hypothetical protein BVU17_12645 [Haloarcula taiwanensis]RLM47659.1 hypothetical protein DVK00_03910 [Haloarcula sp. Atlit-47R]